MESHRNYEEKQNTLNTLPISRATISAPFLKFADDNNIDSSTVLKAFKLNKQALTNPNIYLPTHMIGRLADTVAKLSNHHDLGFHAAQYNDLDDLHPTLSKCIQSNNDLSGLLSTVMTHQKLQGSHFKLWVEYNENKLRIYHKSALKSTDRGFEYANDFTTFKLLGLLRKYLGNTWKPDYLVMENNSPPQAKIVGQTKQYRVITGQKCNYIPVECAIETLHFQSETQSRSCLSSRLEHIIDIFWQHESFSLEFVAHLFGVSERTLQRLFIDQGSSFRDYINKKKLKKSLELLKEGMSVNDVAFELGYSDPSNFTRALKKQINMTPRQYLMQS
ncbi:AraC family transcriptional regulator [Photobacterium makurazakiensis]|uniref:helix-turn-helix domain-containing protein n=1 Tax=Photobacterium makurazakiensis TaxID=2910234 RepID=UPI003D0B314D